MTEKKSKKSEMVPSPVEEGEPFSGQKAFSGFRLLVSGQKFGIFYRAVSKQRGHRPQDQFGGAELAVDRVRNCRVSCEEVTATSMV